jgi:TorA maturation chaperone TorD
MGKVRSKRLSVTLSYPMAVAIQVLCERDGSVPAAMAQRLLRQALDRTIESAEVQRRVRAHNARRTAQEWQSETMEDHIVETEYAKHKAQSTDATI